MGEEVEIPSKTADSTVHIPCLRGRSWGRRWKYHQRQPTAPFTYHGLEVIQGENTIKDSRQHHSHTIVVDAVCGGNTTAVERKSTIGPNSAILIIVVVIIVFQLMSAVLVSTGCKQVRNMQSLTHSCGRLEYMANIAGNLKRDSLWRVVCL